MQAINNRTLCKCERVQCMYKYCIYVKIFLGNVPRLTHTYIRNDNARLINYESNNDESMTIN